MLRVLNPALDTETMNKLRLGWDKTSGEAVNILTVSLLLQNDINSMLKCISFSHPLQVYFEKLTKLMLNVWNNSIYRRLWLHSFLYFLWQNHHT